MRLLTSIAVATFVSGLSTLALAASPTAITVVESPPPEPLRIREPAWYAAGTDVLGGTAIEFSATGGSGTGYHFTLAQENAGSVIEASTGWYVCGGSPDVGTRAERIDLTDSSGQRASAEVSCTPSPEGASCHAAPGGNAGGGGVAALLGVGALALVRRRRRR